MGMVVEVEVEAEADRQAVSVNVMHGIKRQTQNENVCWSFIMAATAAATNNSNNNNDGQRQGSSNNLVRNLSDNFHTIFKAEDTRHNAAYER
ncbi:GH14845 [Drosophila grimshawi]|uniref:GH14845 n=1 Tax=Drosophila grimshawi TaxID=7222 RepID=B4J2M8_DROGR|nr:GH14845 [Drosophila grimshawi]